MAFLAKVSLEETQNLWAFLAYIETEALFV